MNHFFKLIISLFLLINSQISFAQDEFEDQEKLLVEIYEKMGTNWEEDYKNSELFIAYFKYFLDQHPKAYDYNFPKLSQLAGINIVKSEDGLFKIYSWNTGLGGTMRDYNMIFQYKSNGKIFTEYGKMEDPEIRPNTGTFYTEIYTIKSDDGKTYYLTMSINVLMNSYSARTVKAFEIKNGKLNEAKIFHTKAENLSDIHISYYVGYNGIDPKFYFDKKSKQLYVPLIDKKEFPTENFLIYKFDGKLFRYQGVGKI